MKNNRRNFIKNAVAQTAGIGMLGMLPLNMEVSKIIKPVSSPKILFNVPRIKFAVVGMNHGHINSMTTAIKEGGGELKYYYAIEPELNDSFGKRFPEGKKAQNIDEILNDSEIKLVLSAGIPSERAPLGIKVMKAGKDYMVDKPGITDKVQFAEVKKVQKETGQIFFIVYSERLRNKATVYAGELVKSGAIGKVVQTIGLGPHRMRPATRPDWFFDMKYVGGIITDIASHQFDQFLYFTGSDEAKILASQVGNVNNSQYSNFEDFGDAMVKGNHGSGYVRVDWFTPEGLGSWGDGRLTILGTDGYIEIRKNVDVSGLKGGNHLYLVDKDKITYYDCNNVDLPFGRQLVDDVLNRTETAMSQHHCFLTTELALDAQQMATRI